MEATVRFKGWTPSPRAVVVGMERDNKVFTLRFEGLPAYPGGTAYLHIDFGSAGADSIEIVNGLAEITRNITQHEGEKTAYVEIIANNDVVWHSDRMLIYVNPLPPVGEKIEQAYPTAFEQALAQTAADKAAAAKSAADAAATAAGIVTEETARQEAESKRVEAEAARKTAEGNREKAEEAREQKTDAAVKRADDLVKSVEGKLENGDFVGAPGPQGPIGETGPRGEQGIPGAQGEKGDTGATGPQGAPGAQGADGAPGKDGRDGLDAPQIDDTTVSDAAPWSSQHIVDMLCPPLEESGNPVVCYPVAGSKLGVTASWEPTQEGTGTPSPDNIRPIKGRDSVTVERCGENVIEFLSTNDSFAGIKIAVDTEKNITLNGTLDGKGNIEIGTCRLHWLAGKTYTMYVKKVDGSVSLGSGDGITFAYSLFTKNFEHFFRGATNGTNFDAYIARAVALVETELIFMLQCWRNGTVFNNYKFQIEVVAGTTASATYTPYTGSTTTLTLPSTVYGGEVGADGEGQETWGCIESYAGEALPAGWICDRAVYADGATPPTGAQVAYKLATPIPFTATGDGTIKALSGTNTILTDADALTVTGRADPIHIIKQLQAASAASAQALADVERAVTDI